MNVSRDQLALSAKFRVALWPRLLGARPGAELPLFNGSYPLFLPRGQSQRLGLGSEHMYFSSSGSVSEVPRYKSSFRDQTILGMAIKSFCRFRGISWNLASGNVTNTGYG